MNAIPVPEHLIIIPNDGGDAVESVSSEVRNACSDTSSIKSVNQNGVKKSESVVDVFRNSVLCKRICILLLVW